MPLGNAVRRGNQPVKQCLQGLQVKRFAGSHDSMVRRDS
jgi:hypothetical protein